MKRRVILFFLIFLNLNVLCTESKSLKILVATSTFPTLSQTFVINQITGLIDKGHDVSIFAHKFDTNKPHEVVQQYQLQKRAYYEAPPKDIDTYDLIVCEFGTVGVHFMKLKKSMKFKAKIVTFFRGHDISRAIHNTPKLYEGLFAAGDLFVPNCDFFKQRLLKLGAPEDKTLVHYSSIDTRKFYYAPRIIPTAEKVRIITVGRLVEKKGFEDSLKAMKKVIKKHPYIEYIIVGDGGRKSHLKKLARELGIEDNVMFAGWKTQEEVIRLLHSCHIFVLACATAPDHDQEGIPNVLKEALACGLPVVSTYHSGVPEAVKDGENGFLVAEHDIRGLAKKIEKLISQPELWNEFGKNGRKLVEQLFDIRQKSDELNLLLQQAAH